MPEAAPKSCDDRFIRRVHFPFGLKYLARSLPGGIKTMIYLAWFSKDEKVRAVAALWNQLPWRAKRGVELEEVCLAAGVQTARFFSEISGTAFELGIDVDGLAHALLQTGKVAISFYKAVSTSSRVRREGFYAIDLLRQRGGF